MVELPSGTVSMLFSDVEQSTLLLTRLGRAYEQVLDGCRKAQRAAWTAFGGVEMGTEGDSFFVVFAAAEDAVASAVEAQRSLARHDWPDGEQVRVRMGIHTGSPRIHDGGYVGIDVHRAARIAGAAHGGQVVVSDATAKLVAHTLPAGVLLRDLGGHRLKDLNLPEHLHQLLILGAQADFPALKSVGTISSLPVTSTPLLGRHSEVAELAAQLLEREVRLVTLTGPGGSGKTRLASAAAREVVDGFLDGVYFVPLAAVVSAHNIWGSIGEALDLPAGDRFPPALFASVAERRILLVLDNLEQILGADEVVAALLRETPGLRVLATSRCPLNLASEHQFAVATLRLPAADTLEEAEASPAVQLFVDRARAVRATFALTAENSTDVAAICRHLDGLPLAIELAAAQSKVLGPRALLARMDHALDLHGPAADRPARQQALRLTIDWSYRLLPAPQQALFLRLGVFSAGADLHALAAVCVDEAVVEGDPVNLAAGLVDASLVTVTEDGDGEPRFAMLETIRAFALDALADTGGLEHTRRLHAEHFAGVAARLRWRTLWDSHQQAIRGNRLFDLELNNFREALVWATTTPAAGGGHELDMEARIEVALSLLSRAGRMWTNSDPAEGRHWLETVLGAAGAAETAEVGICLTTYAEVLSWQRELTKALEAAQRSVTILRSLDDAEVGGALIRLGLIQAQLGNAGVSRRVFEEVVDMARQSGDAFLLGRALDLMARLEAEDGQWEAALPLLQASRKAMEGAGSDYFLAATDHNIACVLRKLGRVREAHELMSREIHNDARTSPSIDNLSGAEDYAAVLADAGFAELAALLVGASDAERQRIGIARDDWQEREVTEARTSALPALTTTEWNDAYARGGTMTILDALDEALASTAGLRI